MWRARGLAALLGVAASVAAAAPADAQIGGGGGAGANGPVPCDARPGSLGSARVWESERGEPLALGASRRRPARLGETVVFGLTLRNCFPESAARGISISYRAIALELEGLGRAFALRGVRSDGGLGRRVSRVGGSTGARRPSRSRRTRR